MQELKLRIDDNDDNVDDNDYNDDEDGAVEAVDHACGKAAVDQLELRHKLTPTGDSKYQRNYQAAYMKMMTMVRRPQEGAKSTFLLLMIFKPS